MPFNSRCSYLVSLFLVVPCAMPFGCKHLVGVVVIPDTSITTGHLYVTHKRICDYWNSHGKLPADFEDLPVIENRDCSTTDGWGRELLWKSDGARIIEVYSLGKDGTPGGAGEDCRFSIIFDASNPHRVPEVKED